MSEEKVDLQLLGARVMTFDRRTSRSAAPLHAAMESRFTALESRVTALEVTVTTR
jgi:hypothetical protein